ncbi:uncharacterized protein LOC134751694 [Cydia strobilella]|uniref:uncharacterized protein LOC134751694 n=1 Tax=Cydia strobilella TaxID=1100964 RepID=UPI003004871F
MKDSSYHFVNVEETIDQDNSGSENHSENKDVLKLSSMEQDSSRFTENSEEISKPKYYRLDQVVFAESINHGETNTEELVNLLTNFQHPNTSKGPHSQSPLRHHQVHL